MQAGHLAGAVVDEGLVRQVPQPQGGPLQQRVAFGQHGHQLVLFHGRDGQVGGLRHRVSQQAGIEIAAGHLRADLARGRFGQHQVDQRIFAAKGLHQPRYQRERGRAYEAYVQPPALAAGRGARDLLHLARMVQGQLGTFQGRLACLGQRRAPAVALEQLHAQAVFQPAYGLGQRRLRHVQLLGRLPVVERAGQGDEVTQLAQVH